MKWLSTDDLIKQQKTKSDTFMSKNEHNTNSVKAIKKTTDRYGIHHFFIS